MSHLRSLDQLRAASAYGAIAKAKSKEDTEMAQKLPAMLQINGLLATWAFLLAKKEGHLLSSMLDHLRSLPELAVSGGTAEAAFLEWVGGRGSNSGIDGTRLRALTAEALAWSVWLKRAVEARTEPQPAAGGAHGGT